MFFGRKRKRFVIIGLDCATPQLVFDRYLSDLPNLRKLMQSGLWGNLRTGHPPITVPMWMSMMTGKDAGCLGFYGFRNRNGYTYADPIIANSSFVKEPTVWNILSEHKKKSILLGIPQTYPPEPINGLVVTSFLTPSIESDYTYPSTLKSEIKKIIGKYMLDVENFRTENKDELLKQIYEMTEKRFKLARHFIKTKPWDFFMLVEMGPDRIHHAFWKYMDSDHPKYERGNPYENAIRDYYVALDIEIGKFLRLLDSNTAVIVVSDHGAQRMDGGICVNEWLIKNGYLVLKERPKEISPLSKLEVDWSKTRVWAEGGYYSRVFLNVKDREPQGVIPSSDYESVRSELIGKLEAITDEGGHNIGTRVYRPEDIYKTIRGIPPDLFCYFGNLRWRAVGSVGINAIYTHENDTGPDDANHDWDGIFIMTSPAIKASDNIGSVSILNIAPTVLNYFGISIPHGMQGKVI